MPYVWRSGRRAEEQGDGSGGPVEMLRDWRGTLVLFVDPGRSAHCGCGLGLFWSCDSTVRPRAGEARGRTGTKGA